MEDYFNSGRMMLRLSEAMGRLVLSGRELTRLAGFTSRVTNFIQVLDDLNEGKYTRTMVGSKSETLDADDETNVLLAPLDTAVSLNLKPNDGKIIYNQPDDNKNV